MEIAFVLWIGLAFVAASVARSKGLSGFGYFALSFLLSFIVAIIVLAIVPARRSIATLTPEAKCPFCREEVKAEAIVCKHCGRDIEPILTQSAKGYFENTPASSPISASGKWGVALILIGTLSFLSWVWQIRSWNTPEGADVPLWGRFATVIVELVILAWGITLYSKATREAARTRTK